MEYNSSVAVDRGGDSENPNYQIMSGIEWVKLNASNVLWDFNSDYNVNDSVMTIPTEGCLYRFDIGSKFVDCVNVQRIEVALFKLGGTPELDDLWFVIGASVVASGEAHVSNSTLIDCTLGEMFDVRVKLIAIDPEQSVSAKLSGDDDYTAWGWDFHKYIPQSQEKVVE